MLEVQNLVTALHIKNLNNIPFGPPPQDTALSSSNTSVISWSIVH